MAWREELAADLPEPRPSDPSALRDDILDELSDHLTCAAERERLRGGDDANVAARVRARFGDPARIALQLWLDALKERLMAQRITTVFAVVLATAAAIACGLLWSAVRDTRTSLTAALDQNREAAARNAESNAALLARIEELSKRPEQPSTYSMEWNPVRVKLVKGQDGAEPAVAYRATLFGSLYKGGDGISVSKVADEEGTVDFGRVLPGAHIIEIRTPWDASNRFPLPVAPGESVERTIHCPAREIVAADVRVQIDWPQDLPPLIDAAAITVSGPTQPFAGEEWSLPGGNFERTFLVRRDSTVAELGSVPSPRGPGVIRWAPPLNFDDAPEPLPRRDWVTGYYKVLQMVLLSERPSLPVRRPTPDYVGIISVAAAAEKFRKYDTNVILDNPPSFTPDSGKLNAWRIHLPSEMVELARQRVREFEAQQNRTDPER
ncbi:MAG: hypothetical protein KY476_23755, partial [Planctomycetes bacterium]|nr:hypothetical protein [Planctomycetota bacterium]